MLLVASDPKAPETDSKPEAKFWEKAECWWSLGLSEIKSKVKSTFEKKLEDGTVYLPEGTYFGQLYQSKREGHGTMNFKNGSKYEGNWKKGRMHGQGLYTTGDGISIQADFDSDNSGTGKIWYRDHSLYEGEFRRFCKHGFGKYYFNVFFFWLNIIFVTWGGSWLKYWVPLIPTPTSFWNRFSRIFQPQTRLLINRPFQHPVN
jgi:hypothetical protein